MKSRERKVAFYELEVETTSADKSIGSPPRIKPIVLLGMIYKGMKNNGCNLAGADDDEHDVKEIDFNIEKREICILVNRADRSLSDPVFRNLKTRKNRHAGKLTDEAVDTSTYVVIKVMDSRPDYPVMMMTGGAGVYPEFIVGRFNKILKSVSSDPINRDKFNYPCPSGLTDKKYKVNHKFKWLAQKSEMLNEIFRGGRLIGVELVNHQAEGLDGDNGYIVDSESVHLKFCGNSTSMNKFMEIINIVKSKKKLDFDQARIRFNDGNVDRNQTIDLTEIKTAFIRRERIVFDTDLSSCDLSINKVIVDKMLNLC